MNPFPWRPCGLASDTRRALPVKIQLYLPKIQPYLPMHHFLYISSAIRPMQIRLPPMHMLTMLTTGHMHVYSVHSTGEMLRCDRPLRLQIFTRGFRLGIRHRKLHSTTESGLQSACPPERQRVSGSGERRDGVVRHAVRSDCASGEGGLVRRRGIGVVCTCSGKPGPGVLAANAGMCTGEKNRSWVRSDHHVPSKIHGARAPQYLGRAGARRASLRAAREEGGTPFEHWPRVRLGAPSRDFIGRYGRILGRYNCIFTGRARLVSLASPHGHHGKGFISASRPALSYLPLVGR